MHFSVPNLGSTVPDNICSLLQKVSTFHRPTRASHISPLRWMRFSSTARVLCTTSKWCTLLMGYRIPPQTDTFTYILWDAFYKSAPFPFISCPSIRSIYPSIPSICPFYSFIHLSIYASILPFIHACMYPSFIRSMHDCMHPFIYWGTQMLCVGR